MKLLLTILVETKTVGFPEKKNELHAIPVIKKYQKSLHGCFF